MAKTAKRWKDLFPTAARSKADFLLDGEEYFTSVIQAVESAKTEKHYVYILGWMLDVNFQLTKGDKDKTLFKVLQSAADRCVEIRILISDNINSEYAEKLKESKTLLDGIKYPKDSPNNLMFFVDPYTFSPKGIEDHIKAFFPIFEKFVSYLNSFGRSSFGDLLTQPLQRFGLPELGLKGIRIILERIMRVKRKLNLGDHHEKVVIVKGEVKKGQDGLIAFCGGMDFNRNRVFSKVDGKEIRSPALHDNACRLEGPAAWEVLQRFKKRWQNHSEANKVRLLGESEKRPPEMPAADTYVQVVGTYNNFDGSFRDRSARTAFFNIIKGAQTYIYIEDQYLVNLDVAQALNRKIREPNFKLLMLATHDVIENAGLLIPKRRRKYFMDAVLSGTNEPQQEKVVLAVFNRARKSGETYHLGMHAKTLIVDDEIAMFGSMNITRRSFTLESETCAVIFDVETSVKQNFAQQFRIKTWKEYERKPFDSALYNSPRVFPRLIQSGNLPDQWILTNYDEHLQPEDYDEFLQNYVSKSRVLDVEEFGINLTAGGSGATLARAKTILSIPVIFDGIWDLIIDCTAD